MTHARVVDYLIAFGLTLAIEVPFYVAALAVGRMLSVGRATTAGLMVNALSHPIAFVIVVPLVWRAIGWTAAVVLIEIAIVFFEAWLLIRYWQVVERWAISTSLVANLVSLSIGFALFA
jgi:hypothetical protein